jgi:hypothetical protein
MDLIVRFSSDVPSFRLMLQTLFTADGQRGVAQESTLLHNKGIGPMIILTRLSNKRCPKLTLTVGRGRSLYIVCNL